MANKDIIDEAKKRLEFCISVMDGDRATALEDLKFRRGDQWDEQSVRQRELDGRPCLTINNIPAIIHQVSNDVRQNQLAIHVHPVDDQGDKDVAEIFEGLIRHIEYDSNADAAYDTALDSAVSVGFGYFRVVTEYCDVMSFDQDIKIKRIRNPFTVYTDPGAQEADGSDMRYAFITSKMAKDEFERTYPNRDASANYFARGAGDNVWSGVGDGGEHWVRVCEYYRIEEKTETLTLLSDGSTRLATDKQPRPFGVTPIATRPTTVSKVMWYKLTSHEVLESVEIPCPWIPIFPVYGDELDIDGKLSYIGLIRNAKDPKRMENYWLTSATEEIALRTKTPYIGALGQFEGVEDDWNAANNRSFSYLEYNPVVITTDGGSHLAPAPQRQPPADVPAGFIQMAGLMRDQVKAVTGIYDASLGNRSNETSGIAINARQQQGEIANFHFADNLSRAIRHLGRCLVAMIPKIYDANRIIRIVRPDGTAETVEVNKPEREIDEFGQALDKVTNDLNAGKYDVVVESGPAYNTLRQEAAANMIELGGKWTKLMDAAGDLVIRSMDFPHADEIAERLEKTLPPGLVEKDEDELQNMVMTPKGPVPAEQAGQLIGEMDQALEQMQAELAELQSGITKAKIDAESKVQLAEINNQAKLDVEELKGMISMLMARMNPMIAHEAAVVAAADPEHPAQPAPIAQGMEQSPAEMAAQPETDAGEDASAEEGSANE